MTREVSLLCEQLSREVAGYLDERPEFRARMVHGMSVFGDLADIPHLRD